MLRLSSHNPMLDVPEVRAAMRLPRHGPVNMGAIFTKRAIQVPDSARSYHDREGIPFPEMNTRECFAELALELGFREQSSEAEPLWIPCGPLTCEEG